MSNIQKIKKFVGEDTFIVDTIKSKHGSIIHEKIQVYRIYKNGKFTIMEVEKDGAFFLSITEQDIETVEKTPYAHSMTIKLKNGSVIILRSKVV